MKITIKRTDEGMGIYKEDGTPLRYFGDGDDVVRLITELAALPVTEVEVGEFASEEEYERDFC